MTILRLSEAAFAEQLFSTDRRRPGLAVIYGWQFVHFRPAMTAHGWRTPVSGPLGKGWPDYVLVRPRDRRLIFAELKREGGKLTPEQESVLEVLDAIAFGPDGDSAGPGGIEVYVWDPSQLEEIEEVLR